MASNIVLLAQPAASAIVSYDGEALAVAALWKRQSVAFLLVAHPGRAAPSSRGPWRCGRAPRGGRGQSSRAIAVT